MSDDATNELPLADDRVHHLLQSTQGFGEQDANGVDLSLLRANLRFTPTQRIENMRTALAIQEEVRRAGSAARLSMPAEEA